MTRSAGVGSTLNLVRCVYLHYPLLTVCLLTKKIGFSQLDLQLCMRASFHLAQSSKQIEFSLYAHKNRIRREKKEFETARDRLALARTGVPTFRETLILTLGICDVKLKAYKMSTGRQLRSNRTPKDGYFCRLRARSQRRGAPVGG